MKKTAVALAVLALFASGAFAMDKGMKQEHKNMPANQMYMQEHKDMPANAMMEHKTVPAAAIVKAQETCAASFQSVFMDKVDFDDAVEFFLKSSGFWDSCIKPTLNTGADSVINFIFYTKGAQPTDFEIRRSVKAADDFMEELEDYIEDAQKYSKEYKKPKRFLNIQLPNTVVMTDELTRMVKDVNKHYKQNSKEPKVTIAVWYKQALQDGFVGGVDIRTK